MIKIVKKQSLLIVLIAYTLMRYFKLHAAGKYNKADENLFSLIIEKLFLLLKCL